MLEKLKPFLANDTVFTSLLIAGVALVAFMLGQWSVTETMGNSVENTASAAPVRSLPALRVETPGATETPVETALPGTAGNFVASKSGTKYHRVDCPGASQIKSENKIFFATAASAEQAGYTKAANCPGL